MSRPARGWSRDGSIEPGVRKLETSATEEGSKEGWAVKEVVGAVSPESGGCAEVGEAVGGGVEGAEGLLPVKRSQNPDMVGSGGG